ncbi:MAG: hypothetical protein WAU36_12050, partial [Cyclobacteriaceae bacterium]
MKTPYSSFTTRNKYLTKEYPIPVSILGDTYHESLDMVEGKMDYFGEGFANLFNKVGDFAQSVSGGVTGVKNLIGAVKGSTAPVLNSGQVQAAASGSGMQTVYLPQGGSNSNDTLTQMLQMQILQDGKKSDTNPAVMWGGIGLGVVV